MAQQKSTGIQKAAATAKRIRDGVKLAKAIATGASTGPAGIALAVWQNRKLVIKVVLIAACLSLLPVLIVTYFVTNLPAVIFGSGDGSYKDIGTISAIYANVENMGNATRQEILDEHSAILKKVQSEIAAQEAADKAKTDSSSGSANAGQTKAATSSGSTATAPVKTYQIKDTFTSVSDSTIDLAISAYSVKYGDDQNTSAEEFFQKIKGALACCFSYTTTASGNTVTYTVVYNPQKIPDAFGLTATQAASAEKKAANLQSFMESGDIGGSDLSSELGNADSVVQFAKSLLGVPYVLGGDSPFGFDCSGFTAYVYQSAAGISLPHSALEQSAMGSAVDQSDSQPGSGLEPGDLVFFATEGGSTITHCGIYIGNGQFIAANTGSTNCVSIESLSDPYWTPKYICARRLLTTSSGLIGFIENHEGFSPTAYRGVDSWNLTIGYGHVIVDGDGLSSSSVLTQPQAEDLLKKDLTIYEQSVDREFAGYSLTQSRHDALVDLAYGLGAWCWSEVPDLVTDVKSNAPSNQIKTDFLATDHVGDEEVQGLKARRYDEWVLYETGNYNIVSYGESVG